MALILNDMQIRQAIMRVPELDNDKLLKAYDALCEITKRHGATDMELRLWIALSDELNKRGIDPDNKT